MLSRDLTSTESFREPFFRLFGADVHRAAALQVIGPSGRTRTRPRSEQRPAFSCTVECRRPASLYGRVGDHVHLRWDDRTPDRRRRWQPSITTASIGELRHQRCSDLNTFPIPPVRGHCGKVKGEQPRLKCPRIS